MIIATAGNHLRTIADSAAIFGLYGLFFWRQFKSNPGNRLIECGSITLIAFLAIVFIGAGDVPDWLFGAWLILVVLLCFTTLFFLFQRMFRAWARRSNQ